MDYKEKLKLAKEALDSGSYDKDTIEYIFPELKESEDERIRKAIHIYIDWLDGRKDCAPKGEYSIKDMIAWLEKQGESYTKKDVDDAYLKGVTNTKNAIEKQYEATYQIRKDIATFIFNHRGDIKDRAKWMDYLGIRVSFVGEKNEQKPADKVEPFNKYEGLTDFERTLADICTGWIGKEIGWKQYIKDNADILLKIAIKKFTFNSVQNIPFNYENVNIQQKDFAPQNRWKPSDEQMQVLEELVEDNTQRYFHHILKSLYNDLKKIKKAKE